MNTANLNALIYTWTHGTKGLVLLYAIIAVFSLAGLKRGRASLRQYIAWPVTTLATLVVVGLAHASHLVGAGEIRRRSTFGGNPLLLPWCCTCSAGSSGACIGRSAGSRSPRSSGAGRWCSTAVPAQAATSKLRSKARRLPPAQMPLTVAGVAVPFEDEFKHFKFIGTTGTGKSTVMRELLHAALYRGDRAVIADPDGGYLSRFYDPKRGDVILNPFDARSAKWNLFAELRNAYDVDELAQAFIPDRGSDPTWTNFARTLFSAVTAQAQVAGIDDIGELYRLLVAASKDELQVLVTGTPAAPFLEAGSDKLFQGARSTVTAAVKSLDFVRAQQTPLFSVREWVKSGRGVLFLPYQADQISALKAIISIWMRLAIFQTMSLGEGRSPALVRGGRARCARRHQRPARCAHAVAQVRRTLRARAPVDRPGEHQLWPGRRAEPDRELRQYADPALLGIRGRRHGALCVEIDRGAGGRAPGALGQPFEWHAARERSGHRRPQRADRDGARGHGRGDRAAAGPDRVFEIRVTAGLDARGVPGLRNAEGGGTVCVGVVTPWTLCR